MSLWILQNLVIHASFILLKFVCYNFNMHILNIIIFSFTFFISIVICAQSQELDRSMFKSSSMVSLEISKKEIKQVYLDSGQTRTLYCGCFFDKQFLINKKRSTQTHVILLLQNILSVTRK